MIKQIKKRDGIIVEFDKTRIINAILKAMKSTNIIDEELAIYIANDINDTIHDDIVEVEKIQDEVENRLIKSNYPEIAKEYIRYRNNRTKIREKNNNIIQKVKDALNCRNIQKLNANLDEKSFGGRKNGASDIIHTEIALSELIREEVSNAHVVGAIHMHDLSEYTIGTHNCLFADIPKLLKDGFSTRNGDVRGAGRFSTACQLLAVIFQIQSQEQFGGVASMHLDYDLAPYVKKSFSKHFKKGLVYLEGISEELINTDAYIIPKEISIEDEYYSSIYPAAFKYAYDLTKEEVKEGCQSIYHNLNTLESRAGSQVPFTSFNFGRDTSPEGRMISFSLMESSIEGIGKNYTTPIFPISIFQYKKGINDKPGTPNYDLKLKALESLSLRMYPNIINGDFSGAHEDPNNIDTYFASMGCRTFVGYDRNGMGYTRLGRGNVCPITINLPRIGIKHGIVFGNNEPDFDGFWDELNNILNIVEHGLLDRFAYICQQSVRSAPFMYKNGTVADSENAIENGVYEAMKHNSLAFGYIGVAEMCQALFGKNHAEDASVHEFALSVIKYIYDYSTMCSDKYKLNFVTYATPAENLCKRFALSLREEFGVIPNITDKLYITNSHHVPVWEKISIFKKIDIEAPFCKYATGGCITYTELGYNDIKNKKAVESIIDYAMEHDIPYNSINFPIDRCTECNYTNEIEDDCPICHSKKIYRLRKVTGYLTTDVQNFNIGKQEEVKERVKHIKYTEFK
jgi:ribonucleoside-triphosphate reductase